MREITMATSALAELISNYFDADHPKPNWDSTVRLRDLAWLNPQLLPPAGGPEIGAVLPRGTTWGPQPEPWAWAQLTQATISHHVNLLELVGIIIVGGDAERAVSNISESLLAFTDGPCGTGPHKPHFPGPWGPVLDAEVLHPVNLVVAGVQFQRAADALGESPIHDTLEECADRLITAGLDRLGQT